MYFWGTRVGSLLWYLGLLVSAQCGWRGLQRGPKVWGLDLRDRRVCVSLKMQFRAGEGSVLCRPEASTPAWGDLIHDHMERDPACAADLARGQAVAVPTRCQTLDGHSFSLEVVGWFIFFIKMRSYLSDLVCREMWVNSTKSWVRRAWDPWHKVQL